MPEYLILLLMVGVFIVLAVPLKLPMGFAIALSALAGALAGGQGFALRHLVEGAFGFFDIILIIASAMIFMKVLQESGILDSLVAVLLKTFYRNKVLLLLAVMLLVMFPGMITGSSLAAVLSTGPLVAPVLMKLGLPRLKTAAFVAMGAILGMIAPPVNILVMIMGGGVDMPYAGLTLPLLIIVVPLAVIIALGLGLKDLKAVSADEMKALLPESVFEKNGVRLYLPLLLVLALMILQNLNVPLIRDLGLPAIFFIGSLSGLFCGRPFNFIKATQKAVEEAMPILSILAGVGMFIQVMTLTGARGWAVMTFLSLPPALLYASIGVSLPLFGGVSAFGSASVLGVPFLLALINKNALITSSALSAIVGIGDLMPPAAMAARFSAQVVGERSFFKVLRYCLVPALLLLAMGIGVLLLAPLLDKVI
ncbi:MAG: TRAP transporter large permease subunit [Candidatus Aminicenantes bacterium]|nr:TRAP transporter large permease subunit [Candidatus Aminicenantes bacterium]